MTGCGERHDTQMAAPRYFAHLIKRGTAATAFLAQLLAFPGSAQAGFFDELFGQLFRPPIYRSYRAYPPWGAPPGYRQRWHHFGHRAGRDSAARERIIVIERTDEPVERQEPVDIMEDTSLQWGDAVMTGAGIRIFVGDSSDSHGPEDFRRPSEVRELSKIERKALAALDTTASASNVTGGIVTGRSATGRKVTAGEMITDAKGRAIRYVGP